jgi:hypothetical protein
MEKQLVDLLVLGLHNHSEPGCTFYDFYRWLEESRTKEKDLFPYLRAGLLLMINRSLLSHLEKLLSHVSFVRLVSFMIIHGGI